MASGIGFVVTDPSGVLPVPHGDDDDEVSIEVKGSGLELLSMATGEVHLRFAWSELVGECSSQPQSDDPTDMALFMFESAAYPGVFELESEDAERLAAASRRRGRPATAAERADMRARAASPPPPKLAIDAPRDVDATAPHRAKQQLAPNKPMAARKKSPPAAAPMAAAESGQQQKDHALSPHEARIDAFCFYAGTLSDAELDHLSAGLHLARGALAFSEVGSLDDDGYRIMPMRVDVTDVAALLGAAYSANVASVIGAHMEVLLLPDEAAAGSMRYADFLELSLRFDVNFEEHIGAATAASRRGGRFSARCTAEEHDFGALRKAFDMLDTVKTADLTVDEISAAMRKLGLRRDADACDVAACELMMMLTRHRAVPWSPGQDPPQGVTWLEFTHGALDGSFARHDCGGAMIAQYEKLSAGIFFGFTLTQPLKPPPPGAPLPEEVALTFGEGGTLAITAAANVQLEPLLLLRLAKFASCSVKRQSADPDDMMLLTIKLKEGQGTSGAQQQTFIFEVEEGEALQLAYSRAHQALQRVVSARVGYTAAEGRLALPPLQRAYLQGVFSVFDVNGDGVVDAHEIRLIFNVIGSEWDSDLVFARLDTNNTGSVSLEELEDVVGAECATKGKSDLLDMFKYDVLRIHDAFNAFAQDGELRSDELAQVLTILGHTPTALQLAEVFAVVDCDESGTIEWRELLHALADHELDGVEGVSSAFQTATKNSLGKKHTSLETNLSQVVSTTERLAAETADLEGKIRKASLEIAQRNRGLDGKQQAHAAAGGGSAAKGSKEQQREQKQQAAQVESDASSKALLAKVEQEVKVAATRTAMENLRRQAGERRKVAHDKALGARARGMALKLLQSDPTAINGWRIKVVGLDKEGHAVKKTGSVRGSEPHSYEATVLGVNKPRRWKASQFKLRFDEPLPGVKGRTTMLSLDRQAPKAGKRMCANGEFKFLKYPFELLGTKPVEGAGHFTRADSVPIGIL
jgi:Ca2+-binding EF-hand superfamily protein